MICRREVHLNISHPSRVCTKPVSCRRGSLSILNMASLHVFVCLLGLVVLCHSDKSCFTHELVVNDPANPPKECVDENGMHHDFGSEWERDCMMCSCEKEGLTCCNKLPEVGTEYVPEECELLVNKATCSVKMVLKLDKTKECSPV